MRSRSDSPIRKDGPAGRFYEIDGQLLPSVTHILQALAKPALITWAANVERTLCLDTAADLYLDLAKTPAMSRLAFLSTLQTRLGKTKAHHRELQKAQDIGTQTHALIEWNLRRRLNQEAGPEPRVTEKAQWAFMAFEDWAASIDLVPIFVEQIVFSRAHGYAGTMDLYATVEGVETVIDFKTGKAIYAEAELQNVAYQVALAEMGHGRPKQGLIVRLPKVETDPQFEVRTVGAVDFLFPVFQSVQTVWAWWYAEEQKYQARKKGEAA